MAVPRKIHWGGLAAVLLLMPGVAAGESIRALAAAHAVVAELLIVGGLTAAVLGATVVERRALSRTRPRKTDS